MRRKIVAAGLVCVLVFPVSGCGPTIQTNIRKASLGVLESVGALQDTEMEIYRVSVQRGGVPISPEAHRAFNARLEQCLILGRDFNRTAWLYPNSTVGLDQARALTASLKKLAEDVTNMMPDGQDKTTLLLLINATHTVINTALVLLLEKRA